MLPPTHQFCVVSLIEQTSACEKCFLLSRECSFARLLWSTCVTKSFVNKYPLATVLRTAYRIMEKFHSTDLVLEKNKNNFFFPQVGHCCH